MQRLFSGFVLSVLAVSFLVLPVHAAGAPGNVLVGDSETIIGNFYSAGKTVEVRGAVESDVIVAGGNVTLVGDVGGDVLAMGGNVKVAGTVNGNVRVLGGNVEVTGSVGRNVLVGAGTLVLGEQSTVAGQVTAAAGTLELRGSIDGAVLASGGNVILAGEVQGPVDIWVGHGGILEVRDSAELGSSFIYHAAKVAAISPQAKFAKAPQHEVLPELARSQAARGWGKLIWFFSALVTGMVLVTLLPKKLEEVVQTGIANPWVAVGWGAVWLVVVPLAVVLLVVTMIGAPLGLLLFMCYGAGFILVSAVAGAGVGWFLKAKFNTSWLARTSALVTVLIGIFVYRLAGSIPILGWVVCSLGTLWAWGAMLQVVRRAKVQA